MRALIPQFIQEQQKNGHQQGTYQAISLFTDISGFTKLTETLMQQSKTGAELVTEILNQIFEPIISKIYAQGGFVATFEGDAFMALFPFKEEDQLTPLYATQTAFFINQFVGREGSIQTSYGDFELSVKIGLSIGTVDWGLLGTEQQLTYYFRGVAIDGCAQAEQQASPNDIIATQALTPYLSAQIESLSIPETTFIKLTADKSDTLPAKSISYYPPSLADLKPFALDKIAQLTETAEFRDVCSIFISFQNPDSDEGLNNLTSTIIALAANYGGYFNGIRFGDKAGVILVLFGAPISYENTLERAANFLLALQETRVSTIWRAGLTFGQVYAGLVGGVNRCEYTAIGKAVNLSARLMMKADWQEIWTNAIVYEHLKYSFELEALGSYHFKGIDQPLLAYHLLKKRETLDTAFYTGELVGREEELVDLYKYTRSIFSGKFCGVIYVYGEAGIGKSRLIYEFQQKLTQERNVTWMYCPTEEILQQPLNPFKHFLKEYLDQHSEATEAANKARFDEIMDRLIHDLPDHKVESKVIQHELKRTRSVLGALVNLHWEDSLYEQLDPRLRFENSLTALKNLIKAECLRQPVVIELEDGHWLDQESIQFIEMLTRNIETYPLVIICNARHGDDGSKFTLPVPDTAPQHDMDLAYLSTTGAQAFAEQVLEGEVSNNLIEFLMEKTSGNPFFIEQLSLYLQERGLLIAEGTPPYYQLTSMDSEDVPTTINAVLISRLDRLSVHVKRVVQTASVLGREFEVRILSHMLQKENQLNNHVQEAEDEHIWSAMSEMHYLFKHALLRDSAYGMQLRSRLRKLHQLAAEAIEELFANDLSGYYADLAHHYAQAEISEKARIYLQKAGEEAKANYQNKSALSFYDRLLDYPLDEQTQVEIYLKKGEIFNLTTEWDQAIAVLQDGLNGAQAIGDSVQQAHLLITLGDVLRKKGDHDQALIELDKARTIAKTIDDKQMLGQALYIMAGSRLYKGQAQKAVDLYQEALAMCEASHDKLGEAISVMGIGSSYDLLGDYTQALIYGRRALPMLEELGDKKWLAYSMTNIGLAHHAVGDYQPGLDYLQGAISLCVEVGIREIVWVCLHFIGYIHHSDNRDEQAVAYFQEAIRKRAEIGGSGVPYQTPPYLAFSYSNLGRYAEALEMALDHLGHIKTAKKDVETGLTHLVIGLTLMRLQTQTDTYSNQMAADYITRKITEKTRFSANPQPYFDYAIKVATEANRLYTLIPALYYYGCYLITVKNEEEAGLKVLQEAKERAEKKNMAGELQQMKRVCERMGVTVQWEKITST